MMKTIFKKYTALIGVLCTVMLVISGCAFDDLQIAKGNPGTGTVTLSINGANARTIHPTTAFGSYVVTVKTASDAVYGIPNYLTTGHVTIDLPITTAYTIIVDAYMDVVTNATEAAASDIAASKTVSITATDLAAGGARKEIEITLDPVATGNGTFEWHLSYHASIVKAELKIGTDPAIEIHGENAVTDNFKALAAGQYVVTFILTDDKANVKEFVEDLYVYAFMVSSYRNLFQSFHFYDMIDYVIGILAEQASWTDRLAKLEVGFFDDLTVDTDSKFAAVKAEFEHIIGTSEALLPEDLTELKALVDAALIKIVVDAHSGAYPSFTALETALTGVTKNGTHHDLVKTGVGNGVKIEVGKYEVLTEATPPKTVTFNSNIPAHAAADSTGAATVVVNVDLPATTVGDDFPANPVYSTKFGGNVTFGGWFTTATFDIGSEFTATSTLTGDVTAYAKWTYANGTAVEDNDTLVHEYPLITINNSAPFANGNATIFVDGAVRLHSTGTSGALLYKFPAGYENYDWFTVDYALETPAFDAETDSTDAEVTATRYNSSDPVYGGILSYPNLKALSPTLGSDTATANYATNALVSLSANTGGFSWRYNNYQWDQNGKRYPQFFVKITKVTFYKGTRVTIELDANGGDLLTLPNEIKILSGTTFGNNLILGTLPTGLIGDGIITGWNTQADGEGDAITANTVISADATIYAQWSDNPPVSLPVDGDYAKPADWYAMSGSNPFTSTIPGQNEMFMYYIKDDAGIDITQYSSMKVEWTVTGGEDGNFQMNVSLIDKVAGQDEGFILPTNTTPWAKHMQITDRTGFTIPFTHAGDQKARIKGLQFQRPQTTVSGYTLEITAIKLIP